MFQRLKSHGLLLSTALIGGLNYSISKILMPVYIAPSAIIVLRGLSTIFVFGIIYGVFIREKIEKKDFVSFVGCAVFGVAINQLFFYEGLNKTLPINAALMMTITPIVVFLLSVLMRREQFSLIKTLGIALAASGAVLLLLSSGQQSFSGLFLGDLMIFTNAVSWACFLIIVKPLVQKYHPATIVFWMFTIGFVMILPFGYNDFRSIAWEKFTTEALYALLFVLIFATLIAYYFNAAVLKYVAPSVAGSYIYLQPFIAGIIAYWLGKDQFTGEKMLYSILLLGGVFLVNVGKIDKNKKQ